MHPIRKKIVADESMHPIAVQIDYADWLEVERLLAMQPVTGAKSNGVPAEKSSDLNRFSKTLTLREDPLTYQRRVRDEWP